MKTITQDEFTDLLAGAYAVVVNNEYMQYIGYDDQDRLYIADYDMQDFTYLDKVDNISIGDNTILFFIDGNPMVLQLLVIKELR
jgi:hypothetical protein